MAMQSPAPNCSGGAIEAAYDDSSSWPACHSTNPPGTERRLSRSRAAPGATGLSRSNQARRLRWLPTPGRQKLKPEEAIPAPMGKLLLLSPGRIAAACHLAHQVEEGANTPQGGNLEPVHWFRISSSFAREASKVTWFGCKDHPGSLRWNRWMGGVGDRRVLPQYLIKAILG